MPRNVNHPRVDYYYFFWVAVFCRLNGGVVFLVHVVCDLPIFSLKRRLSLRWLPVDIECLRLLAF